MISLVRAQPQRPGQGRRDVRRGAGCALLFEACQVVRRHPRELGDFLSAKSRRTTSGPAGEPDVLGEQRLPPRPQEFCQQTFVHASIMWHRLIRSQGRVVRGCGSDVGPVRRHVAEDPRRPRGGRGSAVGRLLAPGYIVLNELNISL